MQFSLHLLPTRPAEGFLWLSSCWPPVLLSRGVVNADEENGDVSKLDEVPAAKRKGVKRPQPKLDSNRYFRHHCFHIMQDLKRSLDTVLHGCSSVSPGWPQTEGFQLCEHCLMTSVSKAKDTRWEQTADRWLWRSSCWLYSIRLSTFRGVCVFCPTRRRTCGGWCIRWRTGPTGCIRNCSLRSLLTKWRNSARRKKCRWNEEVQLNV